MGPSSSVRAQTGPASSWCLSPPPKRAALRPSRAPPSQRASHGPSLGLEFVRIQARAWCQHHDFQGICGGDYKPGRDPRGEVHAAVAQPHADRDDVGDLRPRPAVNAAGCGGSLGGDPARLACLNGFAIGLTRLSLITHCSQCKPPVPIVCARTYTQGRAKAVQAALITSANL